MTTFSRIFSGIALTVLSVACSKGSDDFIKENIDFAKAQINLAVQSIDNDAEQILTPITINKDNTVKFASYRDWRGGFFPGTLWLLYELTGDSSYIPLAEKYTESIRGVQEVTDNHDVGFICMCSFGNGLRLNSEKYEDVIIRTADALATRFNPTVGLTQSWGESEKLDRKFPVIIDNMMNLELFFKASELSGDPKYYEMAVSHANRTLKEHFRPDGSCYHVVDYDPETGEVRKKVTAQGYSDESIWTRGHAWAVYGYAMAYRFTGDKCYIEQSLKTFDVLRNHPSMPEDCIPFWDMCCPDIPNTPRDASSAAILASALYEISTMDVDNPSQYKQYADKIMTSLSSPAYRAQIGENGNFILMHSVGSLPGGAEVDKPLNYADYYFLEALVRKAKIEGSL